MAHTPGPWSTLNSKDDKHHLVYSHFDGKVTIISEEESEANARLIAAAPSMYQLLRSIRIWIDSPNSIDADGDSILKAINLVLPKGA